MGKDIGETLREWDNCLQFLRPIIYTWCWANFLRARKLVRVFPCDKCASLMICQGHHLLHTLYHILSLSQIRCHDPRTYRISLPPRGKLYLFRTQSTNSASVGLIPVLAFRGRLTLPCGRRDGILRPHAFGFHSHEISGHHKFDILRDWV